MSDRASPTSKDLLNQIRVSTEVMAVKLTHIEKHLSDLNSKVATNVKDIQGLKSTDSTLLAQFGNILEERKEQRDDRRQMRRLVYGQMISLIFTILAAALLVWFGLQ